ncbi:MAG: homoserine dehydrogenase [Deltaproteobacteria bacterium]|nr:homoserine dehydrogenase [Deltaproteobacteria bacterium]
MQKSKNRNKVKLGLLGSGTVGEAIQEFIFKDSKGKVGSDLELEIVKIYTRHPARKKWYSTHPALFTTRPKDVTDHPAADIIIEALGFQQERQLSVFKDYIIRAFQKGKAVVTSDKAVLAKFGKEIWSAAGRYGQELRFEACVGGGIPIIRSLTESFSAEEPEAIYGIVNGTCNYVLSEMKNSGKSYEGALREAQDRGYAETNSKSDTSGMDAEAKLILLAAVTFGLHIEPGTIWRKGIEEIHAIDFLYADRKGGCTIKHLAVANNEGGAIQAYVAPVLVPHDHFLSAIDGPTNAIFFKGKRSGLDRNENQVESRDWNYVFVGPGAGGGATAVAIMGDVCELARGRRQRLGCPPTLTAPGTLTVQSKSQIAAGFYLRFVVKDRIGIVGDICQTFGKAGINVSEIWQLSHSEDELQSLARTYRLAENPRRILPFVITLERATIGQIKNALAIISRKNYILANPIWFPIWNTR